MQFINPKYAALVADYKAAQESTDSNVWAQRDDAPFRTVRFMTAAPVEDDVE